MLLRRSALSYFAVYCCVLRSLASRALIAVMFVTFVALSMISAAYLSSDHMDESNHHKNECETLSYVSP